MPTLNARAAGKRIMQKILLFILLLVGIYFVRRAITRRDADTTHPRTGRPGSPGATERIESMHACAHCGLVVPRSECVEADGVLYCGSEHAQLGPRG